MKGISPISVHFFAVTNSATPQYNTKEPLINSMLKILLVGDLFAAYK
jgi:hypothetical protein